LLFEYRYSIPKLYESRLPKSWYFAGLFILLVLMGQSNKEAFIYFQF
jgi:hypothetical protein